MPVSKNKKKKREYFFNAFFLRDRSLKMFKLSYEDF
jgi:hypothetical protein